MKKGVFSLLMMLCTLQTVAQSIWNHDHREEVKRTTASNQTFTRIDSQLRCLLQQTDKLRRENRSSRNIMPRSVEHDGRLRMVTPEDWCSGFFPGMLWMMYEYTHDSFWRQQADSNTWLIESVKDLRNTHDLGFMINNSFGLAWRLTGEQSYRDVMLHAASTLAARFNPAVGCIRSWDWATPERWKFPVIIDNMMNLEMLFEAARLTGDQRYYNIAVSHANTTMAHHFRPDYSSYHVVDYDPVDGHVIKRITHQGLFDESVWSRGQSWGLYGFTLCFRYTHDQAYLQHACHIADFFFSQPDLPSDLIPYWDMKDPNIKSGGDVPRDASAAAIFASGLYELSTYADSNRGQHYRHLADSILNSLERHYMVQPGTHQGFLLLHSTGNYPGKDEVDVPINYADYYFMEALLRRNALLEQ